MKSRYLVIMMTMLALNASDKEKNTLKEQWRKHPQYSFNPHLRWAVENTRFNTQPRTWRNSTKACIQKLYAMFKAIYSTLSSNNKSK